MRVKNRKKSFSLALRERYLGYTRARNSSHCVRDFCSRSPRNVTKQCAREGIWRREAAKNEELFTRESAHQQQQQSPRGCCFFFVPSVKCDYRSTRTELLLFPCYCHCFEIFVYILYISYVAPNFTKYVYIRYSFSL